MQVWSAKASLRQTKTLNNAGTILYLKQEFARTVLVLKPFGSVKTADAVFVVREKHRTMADKQCKIAVHILICSSVCYLVMVLLMLYPSWCHQKTGLTTCNELVFCVSSPTRFHLIFGITASFWCLCLMLNLCSLYFCKYGCYMVLRVITFTHTMGYN